ncbi:hypothetical protein J2Z82_002480 [Virgibacillus litoralis]|uniref:Uncharacterized protein n=1 Tax=Virgibacillus litoralis TaxID=578221 RepID=A0ABS4HF47_9BACI|nr:hypothetical protein [Virgibacillus litoralis]
MKVHLPPYFEVQALVAPMELRKYYFLTAKLIIILIKNVNFFIYYKYMLLMHLLNITIIIV